MPQNAGSTPVFQFKAGKCKIDALPGSPNKFTISPDTRKGTISLTRGSDGVLHFRWLDRSDNSKVIDDFSIVPKETTFTRVNTGKEDDRVYILRWKPAVAAAAAGAAPTSGSTQPSRRYMFWMQQKDSGSDEANATKVNDLLNQAAPAVSSAQQQFMQMMGLSPGLSPSAPAPAASAAASAAAPVAPVADLGGMDFASLLSGMPAPPAVAASAPAAPPAAPAPVAAAQRTSLYDQLRSDTIVSSGIFEDPAIRERLLTYLPAESAAAASTPEAQVALLRETIHSPQFQQAVEVLGDALAEGSNYTAILTGFGIDPAPGMTKLMAGDPVGAFVDCIAAEAAKRKVASDAAAPAPP